MSDSETDLEADARELTALRELLVERDERIADLTELIRDLRDEFRLLKNLPRRPNLNPSGLAASARGGKERREALF